MLTLKSASTSKPLTRNLFCLVLLLSAVNPAQAEQSQNANANQSLMNVPQNSRLAKIQTILALDGLTQQMNDTFINLEKQLNGDVLEEYKADFKLLFNQAFDANALNLTIVKAMDAQLTDAQIERLLVWYQSDLGKKVAQIEVASTKATSFDPEDKAVLPTPVDATRLKLAERFCSLVGKGCKQSYIDTVEATASGIKAEITNRLTGIELEQAIAAFDAKTNQELSAEAVTKHVNDSIATFYNTYNDLTLDELAQYTNFLESSASVIEGKIIESELQKGITEGLSHYLALQTDFMEKTAQKTQQTKSSPKPKKGKK